MLATSKERSPARRKTIKIGTAKKTLLTKEGSIEIEIPLDRKGDFEPMIITKGEKRSKTSHFFFFQIIFFKY
ncbi:MAG: hypothetical protein DVB29_00085 [Verrucomicrobia bacterium]|nr:MAG: hypothetical protein DVB29_00085 [Verrucomicrobiota bacterium]